MNRQKLATKALMATHLTELMGDTELYGWEVVCAFHAVCCSRSSRTAHLGRSGYQMPLPLSPHVASAISCRLSLTSIFRTTEECDKGNCTFQCYVKPGSKACTTYNGWCTSGAQHPKELHVCSFCLASVNRLCAHQEKFYRRRQYALAKKPQER